MSPSMLDEVADLLRRLDRTRDVFKERGMGSAFDMDLLPAINRHISQAVETAINMQRIAREILIEAAKEGDGV